MFHRKLKLITAAGTMIAALSSGAYAGQRAYTAGVSADVTGGGTGPNIGGLSSTQSNGRFVSFFGTYPSFTLKGHGEHSTLDSSYAYGFSRYISNPAVNSHSHSASLGLTSALGPRWNIHLADSFAVTSDISTFRLLSGQQLASVPVEFRYIFNPVVARSNRSNSASFGLDHILNKRSSLNFGVSHALVDYAGDAQFSGILSNQQRFGASVGYSRTNEHSGWSLGYTGSQFNFDRFQNARSHAVSLGYSRQFSPVLSVHLSGGPSYLETHDVVKHRVSGNASLSVQRTVQRGSFSLTVAQSGNDSSGLGSITSSQQISFNLSHRMGRKATFSSDVSGFDTRARTANSFSQRGMSLGGSMGYEIARMWSLNLGGQYQRYLGNSVFGFNQKRVFVSLRYNNPEVWRF